MRVSIGTFALAATITAFAATDAGAQQKAEWDNYCTLGLNPLCSSIELTLTPDDGWTDFSISLRNLEGTLGSTAWALYNVSFILGTSMSAGGAFPEFQATFSGTGDYLVTASPEECAAYIRLNDCDTRTWGRVEWDWFGANEGSTTGEIGSHIDNLPQPFGVIGCNAPPQPDGYWGGGYFQTCGNGWVNFNFTIPGDWTVTPETKVSIVTWDGANMGNCVFGETCIQTLTSTPEPSTVTLLATGLFAVAIVGHRRRRRKSPATA